MFRGDVSFSNRLSCSRGTPSAIVNSDLVDILISVRMRDYLKEELYVS